MSNVGYATLQVIPSMKGIESKLGSGLTGPMSSAGTKAGKSLGESTKKSFGSSVIGGAKALVTGLGLYEVAHQVKDFFTEAITGARDTQKATAVTAARIKSTGAAAHVSAKQVTELGFALSKKTAVDHAVIQAGENMLLTFKNVRNEAGKGNDIFTQSTHTLVDLAAAMAGNGQLNPKTAAIQLGKALNDPIKGMTALARVGVQFTDQQKAQITAMVGNNNLMGAQKLILKELNSEFGGSAAAQATAGEKMANAWHLFQDEIGTALLPTLDKLENWLLKVGPPAAEEFLKWFKGEGVKGLQDFAKYAADTAKQLAPLGKSLLQTGREALPAIASALKTVVPLFKGLADAFIALPKGTQKMVLMGAAAVLLSRRLGLLSGVTAISRSMGLLAGTTASAGGAAAVAAPRFAAMRAAIGTVGFWAAIADGVKQGADRIGDIQALLSKPVASRKDGLAGTLETIKNSNFAKYAGDLGINLDRLAASFHRSGAKGAYVQDVFAKLQHSIGPGGFKALADTLIPLDDTLKLLGHDMGWNADKALAARGALQQLLESLKGVKQAAGGKAVHFDLLTLMDPAIAGLQRYRSALLKLPRKVLTAVETPGAIQSVKDVELLAKKFNLTPHEVRTIMKAEDFATAKIRKVVKDLDIVHKPRKPVPLDANPMGALSSVGSVIAAFDRLRKQHPKGTLDANPRPATLASQIALGWFGKVDKTRAMAILDANNGQALTKVQAVRNAIQGLVSHPWSIFVGTTGPGAGGAPHRASGGPIAAGQTYMVGERGPELFTSTSAGQITSNDALRRHLAAARVGSSERSTPATMTIVGTLDTPFGPAEVRGIAREEVAAGHVAQGRRINARVRAGA